MLNTTSIAMPRELTTTQKVLRGVLFPVSAKDGDWMLNGHRELQDRND